MVIYNIKCQTCGAEYVGKTKRILRYRISEHKQKGSACHEHQTSNPGHEIDYDGVKVIDSADNNFKLCVKELLHILKKKPEMNKQLNAQSDYEIKTVIVKAYPQFREETN